MRERREKFIFEMIRSLSPDIVTLDIEMPRLDGLHALEQIMTEMPRPVVMLSAAGSELGQEMTLRALERGAGSDVGAERALDLGAWGFDTRSGPMELNIPAI